LAYIHLIGTGGGYARNWGSQGAVVLEEYNGSVIAGGITTVCEAVDRGSYTV